MTFTQLIVISIVAFTIGLCVGVIIAALMSRSKMDDLEMDSDIANITIREIHHKIANYEQEVASLKPSSAVLFAWMQDLVQDIKNICARHSTNG